MATIRTTFDDSTNKDLLKVGTLRKIFDSTVRKAVEEYKNMYKTDTTDLYEERETELAGLDWASEFAEGQNIGIQAPQRGETKEYTQRFFGTGFRMTFAMDHFNKYGLWKRWAKSLGKVMTESMDDELAVLWNNPTSTTLTCGTGYDGLALANAAHTGLKPNSTADNYNNYGNAALSHTAMLNARYYYSTLKDSMGHFMGAKADTLYFEATLWPTVSELLGSEGKPYEMSNTDNVIPRLGVKPFEYHRLSSTTAWGMLNKNDEDYDIKCLISLKTRMFTKDAPDNTQDRIITAMNFFTYGWGDARRVYVGKT